MCTDEQFQCRANVNDIAQCISKASKCDGTLDCSDGSDEGRMDCNNRYQVTCEHPKECNAPFQCNAVDTKHKMLQCLLPHEGIAIGASLEAGAVCFQESDKAKLHRCKSGLTCGNPYAIAASETSTPSTLKCEQDTSIANCKCSSQVLFDIDFNDATHFSYQHLVNRCYQKCEATADGLCKAFAVYGMDAPPQMRGHCVGYGQPCPDTGACPFDEQGPSQAYNRLCKGQPNCCSQGFCKVGEGACTDNSQCAGVLRCGIKNCPSGEGDCCEEPSEFDCRASAENDPIKWTPEQRLYCCHTHEVCFNEVQNFGCVEDDSIYWSPEEVAFCCDPMTSGVTFNDTSICNNESEELAPAKKGQICALVWIPHWDRNRSCENGSLCLEAEMQDTRIQLKVRTCQDMECTAETMKDAVIKESCCKEKGICDTTDIQTLTSLMQKKGGCTCTDLNGTKPVCFRNTQFKNMCEFRCGHINIGQPVPKQAPTDGPCKSQLKQKHTGCEIMEFACGNNQCVHHSKRCDGQKDCDNNADEEKCEGSQLLALQKDNHCSDGKFKCQLDGNCIDQALVCDGNSNCVDGSDEANCDRCAEKVGTIIATIRGARPDPCATIQQGGSCMLSCDEAFYAGAPVEVRCDREERVSFHPDSFHCEPIRKTAGSVCLDDDMCEQGLECYEDDLMDEKPALCTDTSGFIAQPGEPCCLPDEKCPDQGRKKCGGPNLTCNEVSRECVPLNHEHDPTGYTDGIFSQPEAFGGQAVGQGGYQPQTPFHTEKQDAFQGGQTKDRQNEHLSGQQPQDGAPHADQSKQVAEAPKPANKPEAQPQHDAGLPHYASQMPGMHQYHGGQPPFAAEHYGQPQDGGQMNFGSTPQGGPQYNAGPQHHATAQHGGERPAAEEPHFNFLQLGNYEDFAEDRFQESASGPAAERPHPWRRVHTDADAVTDKAGQELSHSRPHVGAYEEIEAVNMELE